MIETRPLVRGKPTGESDRQRVGVDQHARRRQLARGGILRPSSVHGRAPRRVKRKFAFEMQADAPTTPRSGISIEFVTINSWLVEMIVPIGAEICFDAKDSSNGAPSNCAV
jgi:hypothetical protein